MGVNHSTSHYKLSGKIGDSADKLKLLLFVDADLAGDTEDSKSRSGGYLVLAGPNTWFPIAWISRKQTATSRSTTEAAPSNSAMRASQHRERYIKRDSHRPERASIPRRPHQEGTPSAPHCPDNTQRTKSKDNNKPVVRRTSPRGHERHGEDQKPRAHISP